MKKLLILALFVIFQYTNANVIILNGLTHTHETESGKLVTGVIKLKNTKESEQRVIIYFNDLFQHCGEKTKLTNDQTHSRSLKEWLSTEVDEYVLKPKEEYELIYNINIPENVDLTGSYWGVLMVEIEKPIKEDNLEYSVKLESKVRYGIQIIADVNSKTICELDFNNIQILKTDEGANAIEIEVKNLGNFYVQPTVVLDLFNEEGVKQKKLEVKFKKIYPGQCKLFTLDISEIPKGKYNGVIVADYGEDMYAIDIEFEK